MTGLEISLLIIGVIVFVTSFIFASKMDKYDEERKMELTEKQKNEIDKQVKNELSEQIDHIKEKTEIELDKLSNIKMNEMNEYSDTILKEINRNHNEVMFLYDMLNEKKKEVNNAIRDISSIKKELADIVDSASKVSVHKTDDASKEMNFSLYDEKKVDETSWNMDENYNNDEHNEHNEHNGHNGYNEDSIVMNSDMFTPLEKVAIKDIVSSNENNTDNNNNAKILKLYAQGKDIVEIAKELGLGIGEVKLVVELFRGGK